MRVETMRDDISSAIRRAALESRRRGVTAFADDGLAGMSRRRPFSQQ
jgi:hypothetical protein